MGTWNSRGLRGDSLEEMINYSIERYRDRQLALIQKIPTPITPINIDRETRHITLAYFDSKSTVDYIGVVQGIPVCFDAKECASDTVPLQNIHEHQMRFMQDFEQQGGVSFIILYLSHRDEAYYVPFRDLVVFWNRAVKGGRKSFRRDEIDLSYRIRSVHGLNLHFLEQIQEDLNRRNDEDEDGE